MIRVPEVDSYHIGQSVVKQKDSVVKPGIPFRQAGEEVNTDPSETGRARIVGHQRCVASGSIQPTIRPMEPGVHAVFTKKKSDEPENP